MSDRRSKLSSKIGRPDKGISTEPSKLSLKPAGVSFVPGRSTDTGATTLPDESLTSIVQDKPVSAPAETSVETPAETAVDTPAETAVETAVETAASEVKPNSLLSLTPICLQNTDLILNTSLFMCLDQGHDFRAGDNRTINAQQQPTWVDYEFKPDNKKNCYLNKINANDFNTNYYASSDTGEKQIPTDKIFGQNDFIKGLLNTTIIGGNGGYGLVIVEDILIDKLGPNKENFIVQKITEKIHIKLKSISGSYYIYSDDDCKGASGIKMKINESDELDESYILFIPFYQRVYDGDMHKVWSFNSKKHIYLIKLDTITISRESNIIRVINSGFSCEFYTIIDQIVPQYVLNFGEFIGQEPAKSCFNKKKIIDSKAEELYDMFLEYLFNGNFSYSLDDKKQQIPINRTTDTIVYKDNLFNYYPSDRKITGYIPRGAKYYFPNCQVTGGLFNSFLGLLYKYQKPFIHPEYSVSQSQKAKYAAIENAKNIILQNLLSDQQYIDLYNGIKNNSKSTDDEKFKNFFIEKQYGFVTDTTIGSAASNSTIDYLADKFNNLPDQTTCPEMTGGAFDNLANVNRVFDLKLEATTEKFYKINSTSNDFDNKIEKYSNNLQLYYDYKPRNKGVTNEVNYFNNCWNSKIFYDEPGQSGGADSSYPYKFAVFSGQLDSSPLGGESIPQYHPPEIDIYMPIFEITGEGKLKGIIVRMVFVKEIMINAINSKSKTIVFCHFVYVDFLRTGITEPANRSEYPAKIAELLKYAIEHTEYVKDTSDCVNIDELKEENVNSDENIDFKLNFIDGNYRNWYKYFSNSQGPSVQMLIVIPTDSPTIDSFKRSVEGDYVASGIVNVAENLIKNSKQLRNAYNIKDENVDENPNLLFFMKLFLIRNKYTGDKSRSSDTLFLNQTKYLEGVQVSNDENTLYNAQMFGLNTIWSTSAKSVFYMSPYLTGDEKFSLTKGLYVNDLCSGLKGNPIYVQPKSSNKGKQIIENDYTEHIKEFQESILNNIDLELLPENVRTDFDVNNSNGFLDYLSTGENELRKLYNLFNECMNSSIEYDITSDVQTALENYEDPQGNKSTIITNLIKSINGFEEILSGSSGYLSNFCEFEKQINSNKDYVYTKLSAISTRITDKRVLNNLFPLIVTLSKYFPWWIKLILDDLKNKIYNKVCSDFILFIEKINDLIVDTKILYSDRFKIYKTAQGYINRFKTSANFKCFEGFNCADIKDVNIEKNKKPGAPFNTMTSIPLADQSKYPIYAFEITKTFEPSVVKYLQPIDNQEILDLPRDQQDRIVKLNDDKFLKASVDFLNKLKTITNESVNLSEINVTEMTSLVDATTIGPIDESYKFKVKMPAIDVRETPGEFKQPIKKQTKRTFENEEDEESNKKLRTDDNESDDDFSGGGVESDTINKFYTNTYKCNVGNYLKKFIPIINNINKLLVIYSKNCNLKLDSSKTLVIKVLLLYIDLINNSYTPKIDSNLIIKSINKIDETFTIEQMNTILNTYSKQLDTYMVINNIINNKELSNIDLVNLLINTIDYNSYNSLNLPFPFLILKNTIKNNSNFIQSEQVEEIQPINIESTSSQPSFQSDDKMPGYNQEPYMIGRQQLEIEQPNYSMGLTYGGVSLKNRKKCKISKTRNNKIKSKKQTIKKRNKKHKYSRRH